MFRSLRRPALSRRRGRSTVASSGSRRSRSRCCSPSVGDAGSRSGSGELHVGIEDPFRPAAKAHPALLVESTEALETLAASLETEGLTVTWADEAEIPGQRRFYVNDPWGNRLELIAAA